MRVVARMCLLNSATVNDNVDARYEYGYLAGIAIIVSVIANVKACILFFNLSAAVLFVLNIRYFSVTTSL